MGLLIRAADVKDGAAVLQTITQNMSTKMVYGNESSLMVATRPGGYHSRPHIHDCEQINFVQDGQMWVFIEKEAFEVKAGDFFRVPPMAVHWAWNRSDMPCTMVEVHAPALEPYTRLNAEPLFDQGEVPNLRKAVRTYVVSDQYLELEKQIFGTEAAG